MTDAPPLPSPTPVAATWSEAGLLAVGLLAFIWVSDIQGVMLHRSEFELGDWLRPMVTYLLVAGLVVWQWDRVARIFLSLPFLFVGGGLTAAIVLASLPDERVEPAGVPALRAGMRQAQPEVVLQLGDARSVEWLTPGHVARPTSSAERLGIRVNEGEGGSEGGSGSGLTADLPPGWVELPPSEMRLLNFGIPGEPQVECYVSSLPGAAGSVLANINRWRNEQMGQSPLDEAGLASLPRVRLLGVDGVQVECDGTFQGRGGDTIAEARLLGVIAALPQVTVFLKMTGPRAAVDAQRTGFELVRDTLRIGAANPRGVNPHGANPPPVGPPQEATRAWRWEVPTGWREAPARSMRVVTFVPESATGVECYVTELPGEAGGLVENVNRWRDQFGLGPLTADAIAALPTVPMAGGTGTIVEAAGSFSAMGSTPQADQGLLGAVCPLPTKMLFVKMIGPRAAVVAERERFVALCRSLRGE